MSVLLRRKLGWVFLGLIAFHSASIAQSAGNEALNRMLDLLTASSDIPFQRDVFRGIAAALQDQNSVPMPEQWPPVEKKFAACLDVELRLLSQTLSLKFGSVSARKVLLALVVDAVAEESARRRAFDALITQRDASLLPTLQKAVKDPLLRGQAIRALASTDDPATPGAILESYTQFNSGEKRDALNTLASRASFAGPLLASVSDGKVPKTDLTAELVRQLRSLKNTDLNASLTQLWGVMKETSPDMQKEIERYRKLYWAGGSQPGDAPRGRVVFNKVCAQCHYLFDTGGDVGPNITGANRSDLEYLLQNILYPNAVIPNEYRAATLETTDDRVITGIIKSQDNQNYAVQTANEKVTLAKKDVRKVEQSEISMMPEGLVANLSEQEFRDLLYYLSRPGQVVLPSGNP